MVIGKRCHWIEAVQEGTACEDCKSPLENGARIFTDQDNSKVWCHVCGRKAEQEFFREHNPVLVG